MSQPHKNVVSKLFPLFQKWRLFRAPFVWMIFFNIAFD
ncbi:hypothetical protein J507_0289 [Acinetobacter sp. 1295259]|nr:hypothetical protein J507_0289 [Acinetobacter sp. 1295259]